jgi:ribonuclease HI
MTLATHLSSELAAAEQRLETLLGERPKTSLQGAVSPETVRDLEVIQDQSIQHLRSGEPAMTDRESTPRSFDNAPAASDAAPSTQSVKPAMAMVFTDGSAEGNPGPGGFCAIVRVPGLPDRELSGGTNHTTNNKMELAAAIVGVRAALDAGASHVTVVSDSEYMVKGMTRWLSGWLAKGWRTSDGQPVKNRELWEQLAELAKRGTLQWQWIRGHAGHPENERCDAVATAAARNAAKGP